MTNRPTSTNRLIDLVADWTQTRQFSLHDSVRSLDFGDQIQLHLIQLSKYHVEETKLSDADAFERWVYFLTESQDRDPEELRQLIPDATFNKAIGVLEMIAKSPELRLIYDDRAKEAKDRFSEIRDAEAKGRAEGEVRGKLIGQVQFLQRMLGDRVIVDSEFHSLEITELQKTLADLESRFQNHS